MFTYDPPEKPEVFVVSPNKQTVHTYGGHPYSSPEQDCRKILDWFTRNPLLSEEQAVYDLKIGNIRQRIAHLRKRGYLIHGRPAVMEISATRLFTAMTYALHRSIPPHVAVPSMPRNRRNYLNHILTAYLHMPHLDVATMDEYDQKVLCELLLKMQEATS